MGDIGEIQGRYRGDIAAKAEELRCAAVTRCAVEAARKRKKSAERAAAAKKKAAM